LNSVWVLYYIYIHLYLHFYTLNFFKNIFYFYDFRLLTAIFLLLFVKVSLGIFAHIFFYLLLFFPCHGVVIWYPNRFIRKSFFMPSQRFSDLRGKKCDGPWQTRERNSICECKDPLLLRFTARIIGSSANKVSAALVASTLITAR